MSIISAHCIVAIIYRHPTVMVAVNYIADLMEFNCGDVKSEKGCPWRHW